MCASRKKLRLFCSCFSPHFFYCTSCPILCSAGFPERAGKCFSHCTCAKAKRPSTSSTKRGCRRARFCFSPAAACGASLGKLRVCALLCPVCPRDGDADTSAAHRSSHPAHTTTGCVSAEAAGGLHGGKRCRWVAWWWEMQVLQRLSQGMWLGHLRWGSLDIAGAPWPPCSTGLFLPLEKEFIAHMVSYSWEEPNLGLGDKKGWMVKQRWLQSLLPHAYLFPDVNGVRQLWFGWDNPALAWAEEPLQYTTITRSFFIR